MTDWTPIRTRPLRPTLRPTATTLDAAFAVLDDRDLRLETSHTDEAPIDLTNSAKELVSAVQSQLAQLEAQRDKLAALLAQLSE